MASEFTSYKSTVDTDLSVLAVCTVDGNIYIVDDNNVLILMFYKTVDDFAIGTIFDNRDEDDDVEHTTATILMLRYCHHCCCDTVILLLRCY